MEADLRTLTNYGGSSVGAVQTNSSNTGDLQRVTGHTVATTGESTISRCLRRSDLRSCRYASQYELSDSELLYSEGMAPEEVKGSIPDQTASIRPVTFRPEEALQSTQFWIGSSRSDAPVPRGSIPEGTSLVAVPGKGSLSVTGPTRSQQGGAKPNSRLSSVTSGQKRPPTSELRQGIQGVIGGKALGTEEPSQAYSGSRVSRRDLIVLGSSISLW